MKNTFHKIIIGDSRRMEEIDDTSVHLVVTSPPYPMIEMWDTMFQEIDPKINNLWEKMQQSAEEKEVEKIVMEIYNRMHEYLEEVWKEC